MRFRTLPLAVIFLSSLSSSSIGCKTTAPHASALATVSLGKFTPTDGHKPWQSMKIKVIDAKSKETIMEKKKDASDFAGTGENLNMVLYYGSYQFELSYFDDLEHKSLLYSSCESDKGVLPKFTVNEPKLTLKVEICEADGNESVGHTPAESEVSISPFIKPSVEPIEAHFATWKSTNWGLGEVPRVARYEFSTTSTTQIYCEYAILLTFFRRVIDGSDEVTVRIFRPLNDVEFFSSSAPTRREYSLEAEQVFGSTAADPKLNMTKDTIVGVCRSSVEEARTAFEDLCRGNDLSKCSDMRKAN